MARVLVVTSDAEIARKMSFWLPSHEVYFSFPVPLEQTMRTVRPGVVLICESLDHSIELSGHADRERRDMPLLRPAIMLYSARPSHLIWTQCEALAAAIGVEAYCHDHDAISPLVDALEEDRLERLERERAPAKTA